MNNIPIIFLRSDEGHGGPFFGVPLALRCAKRWNERVVFIGDSKQPVEWRGLAEWHEMERYSESKERLWKVWPHKLNPNGWHSWGSMSPWLVLADFCEAQGIEFCSVFDTDVLVMANVTEEGQHWRQYAFSRCDPLGSPQAPSFVSLAALKLFRGYMMLLYESGHSVPIKDREIAMQQCGCCMSAWRWMHHEFSNILKVGNLCDVVNGATFDHSLPMAYGSYLYDGVDGLKKMHFIKGQPWCQRIGDNGAVLDSIRFNALHCWSNARAHMKELFDASERTMT